ncbi:MAG: 5'-nucleotidase [Acidimicrobiales bacterium]
MVTAGVWCTIRAVRILVTNDDGIDSTGLHVLAQRLTEVGEVTVFAPSGEYSGAGAAIGHLGPGIPDVHRVERPELSKVAVAYHMDSPPALCSLLACKGLFGELPDIVVSGINPGWNVGHAAHFSGTIGAGITASLFGIPALAMSQPAGETQLWETAAEVAAGMVHDVLGRPRLLNVNVPNLASADLAGSKQTVMGDRFPYSLDAPSLSKKTEHSFAVSFTRDGTWDSFDGSDTEAVESGYVSVTELTPTHTAINSDKLAP